MRCLPLLSPDDFLPFCVGSPLISSLSLISDTWQGRWREMERDVSSAQHNSEEQSRGAEETPEGWSDGRDGEKDGRIYRMRRGVVGVKSCRVWPPGSGG